MLLKSIEVGILQTNCYIAGKDGKAVIIDPGDEAEKISSYIEDAGLEPEAILITHAHPDHILGVMELWTKYRTVIYAAETERYLMEHPEKAAPEFPYQPELPGEITYLSDNEEFEAAGLKFRTIHTPGHTAGSCCFYLASENILFSGDTLFEDTYGRTDLFSGSFEAISDSIGRKLMALPDSTAVLPGHGPSTEIEHERKWNPAVRYYNMRHRIK